MLNRPDQRNEPDRPKIEPSPFPLRKRLTVNFAANIFALATQTLVQIVSVPLFLFFWSKELYGEWILISAIPTYLSLAEAGFATTAGNEIGMAVATGNLERARCSLHTAWGFLAAICIPLLALAFGASFAIPWSRWLKLSVPEAAEICWVIFLLSAYTLAGLVFNVLGAVYRVTYKVPRFGFLMYTGRLVELGAIAVSVAISQSMVFLASIMLATRVATVLIVYLDSRHFSPTLNLGLAAFSMEELKRTWRPSVLFMCTALGNALYFQGLTLLVGNRMGVSSVVVFNTTRTLTRTIVQFVTVIKHSAWVEFPYLFGAGDLARARRLNGLALEVSWVTSATLAMAVYFVAPWIMALWTHDVVEIDRALLAILLLSAVLNTVWFVPSGLLQGVNRHEGFALRYLLATSASLIVGALLVRPLGLAGVAWSMVVCEILLVPYVIEKTCQLLQCSSGQLVTDALCLRQSFALILHFANRYSLWNR